MALRIILPQKRGESPFDRSMADLHSLVATPKAEHETLLNIDGRNQRLAAAVLRPSPPGPERCRREGAQLPVYRYAVKRGSPGAMHASCWVRSLTNHGCSMKRLLVNHFRRVMFP